MENELILRLSHHLQSGQVRVLVRYLNSYFMSKKSSRILEHFTLKCVWVYFYLNLRNVSLELLKDGSLGFLRIFEDDEILQILTIHAKNNSQKLTCK